MRRPIRHILFYGTLRRGTAEHRRLIPAGSLTFLGERVVAGRLYDLGAYPGLAPGPGSVRAELFRIERPLILSTLDRYEGYVEADPGASLFLREAVTVPRLPGSAEQVDAWIYVCAGPVTGRRTVPKWPR